MKGKLLFAFGLLFALFTILSMDEVYAYHPSNWDLANEYHDLRIPRNRMHDYFSHGSIWQGDVVIDETYSDPPRYYPRRVAIPRVYKPHYYSYDYYDYNSDDNYYLDYDRNEKKKYSRTLYNKLRNYPIVRNEVHVHYHDPPVPRGNDASMVVGCGYEDGYYRPCY